jgi:hypothetical protein
MYQGIIGGMGRLFRSGLQGLRRRRDRRYQQKQVALARPVLEPLEPRRLLATFLVDTLVDAPVDLAPGPLSLREAILLSNTNSQNDTIQLTLPGTYTLSIGGTDEDAGFSGDLDITEGGFTTTVPGDGCHVDDYRRAGHRSRVPRSI